MTYVGHLI